MTSTMDMVEELQELGDILTTSVMGATLKVDFKADEKVKYIEIEPIDNKISDGSRAFMILLSETEGSTVNSKISSAMFTLVDDEPYENAKVFFKRAAIDADAEKAVIEICREGALNSMVRVDIRTEDVTAVAGRDYSPVAASVVFPFGITTRTIEIPVRTDYLTDTALFKAVLENPVGAEITDVAQTIVGISPNPSDAFITAFEASPARLMAANTTSTIRLGTPIDLQYGIINSHHKGNSSINCYNSAQGRYIISGDEKAEVAWNIGGKHLDYAGFRYNWMQECGAPAYPYTSFLVSVGWKNDTNAQAGSVFYREDMERWARTDSDHYFPSDACFEIEMEQWRGSFIGRQVYCYVYSITPILRPFTVSLKLPEPLSFLDASGHRVPNQSYTQAKLENADSDGTAVFFSGEQVQVTNTSDDKTKLIGLDLVGDNKTKRIVTNKDGAKTLSFELTNAFLCENQEYLKFEANGSLGKKGSFQIQPVYAYRDATVRVMKSEKGHFNATDGNDLNVSSAYRDFSYHLYDVISLSTTVNDAYKKAYKGSGVTYASKVNAQNNEWANELFAEAPIGALAPGEHEAYTLKLDIPADSFERFGYLECHLAVYEPVTDKIISNEEDKFIRIERPAELTLNQTPQLKRILLQEGEWIGLNLTYAPAQRFHLGNAVYSVDDADVATISGSILAANEPGLTTLHAIVDPYGAKAEYEVVVIPRSVPSDTDNTSSAPGIILPSVSPEPTVVPSIDANGNITIAPKENKDTGVANANISAETLEEAFEKASESGNDSKATQITIPPAENATAYAVTLPAEALSSANDDRKLVIATELAFVTLPGDMLPEGTHGEAQKVSLKIAQADLSGMDEGVRAQIGDRPVLQLGLEVDGAPYAWHNDKSPVTVTIPYTPTEAELANPDAIIIWYIDGGGNMVCVPNGTYDPETGTVTFTTTHFSNYAVGFNPVFFKDVPQAAWYSQAVGFIAARGITTGTDDGIFSPDAKLTRAQTLVMLMRAYGIAPDENPADNFSDAGNAYYTGYLAAARRLGISAGVGNNLFAPNNEVSRQEMFVLLLNTLRAIEITPQVNTNKNLTDFTDSGDIAPWARDAMTQLVAAGIISGSGGKLMPLEGSTRAQNAQVIYRLFLNNTQRPVSFAQAPVEFISRYAFLTLRD